MANPLTLARVWRILKEVDLEAIRREAETPLRLLLMADDTSDADDLAVLMAGDEPDAAQWITSVDTTLASQQAGSRTSPVVDGPDVVVALARGKDASTEFKAARQVWLDRKVRLVTVVVGGTDRPGKVRRHGSVARVAVDRLDAGAVGHVAEALFSVVRPDQRIALARQFPGLRPCAFDQLVSETARANAGYSLSTGVAEIIPLLDVPLNIGDMIVLTKNQLVMGYRIALAAGKRGRPRDLVGEIVGVLGGGLIFRQLARQLIGLIPVLGIVPKVAVAYGGTWAIGRAVIVWATEGQKLTGERLRELSREGLARGRRVARAMKRTSPAA